MAPAKVAGYRGALWEFVMDTLKNAVFAKTSRRTMLAGGIAAGAASLMGATGAKAMIKVSQASVGYKKASMEGHNCGVCKLFEAPSSCRFVQGAISPDCSCRIWLSKVG